MKRILEKYKILIFTSCVLLSIVTMFSIINTSIFNEKKFNTISSIEKQSAKENKEYEIVDGESSIVVENNNMHLDKKENHIEENINNKSDSTYSDDQKTNNENQNIVNNKDQTKFKLPVSKETNNNHGIINGDTYTVKAGDTLFLIGQRADVSVSYLKDLNNLSSDQIYENQKLKIKGVKNNPPQSNSLDQLASRGERSEDLYWLSRIIHAEAQGESYEGKVAVGNVIINRVNSSQFPNTIKGVVFDKQNGYTQFSPVIDGTIYNIPDAESIKAATDVLNGSRPVGSALYFLNPRKSTNFWIIQNRKYMKTIGLHDFYY